MVKYLYTLRVWSLESMLTQAFVVNINTLPLLWCRTGCCFIVKKRNISGKQIVFFFKRYDQCIMLRTKGLFVPYADVWRLPQTRPSGEIRSHFIVIEWIYTKWKQTSIVSPMNLKKNIKINYLFYLFFVFVYGC